jgi:hypothetical protein
MNFILVFLLAVITVLIMVIISLYRTNTYSSTDADAIPLPERIVIVTYGNSVPCAYAAGMVAAYQEADRIIAEKMKQNVIMVPDDFKYKWVKLVYPVYMEK